MSKRYIIIPDLSDLCDSEKELMANLGVPNKVVSQMKFCGNNDVYILCEIIQNNILTQTFSSLMYNSEYPILWETEIGNVEVDEKLVPIPKEHLLKEFSLFLSEFRKKWNSDVIILFHFGKPIVNRIAEVCESYIGKTEFYPYSVNGNIFSEFVLLHSMNEDESILIDKIEKGIKELDPLNNPNIR